MSINPKKLSTTATLTFSDDFDTLSLWNGASGTWDSTYFWAPATGIEITGAQQVNWNINSNYAPTRSDTPWTVSNGVLDLHAGPAPAVIQPYIDNAQYTSGMITSYHSFSPVSIGGVGAGAFVFQPHTAAGAGGPAYSGIDGHGLQPEQASLMATAGAAPSHHPWFDDAGLGHLGSIAETHMGHFIIH